ncbi:nuclear transport factor 2 family protein [Chitinimonas naiadis]
MTDNKQTIERYMAGFRASDHAMILACLTDDVVWEMAGAFHLGGKVAFDGEIQNEAFVGSPIIAIHRLTEENDVVVAEGALQCQRREGGTLNAFFCDVFTMRDTRISRLATYLTVLN